MIKPQPGLRKGISPASTGIRRASHQPEDPKAVPHHTMIESPPTNGEKAYLIDIINFFYYVFRLQKEHPCNTIHDCFPPALTLPDLLQSHGKQQESRTKTLYHPQLMTHWGGWSKNNREQKTPEGKWQRR